MERGGAWADGARRSVQPALPWASLTSAANLQRKLLCWSEESLTARPVGAGLDDDASRHPRPLQVRLSHSRHDTLHTLQAVRGQRPVETTRSTNEGLLTSR